MNSRFMRIVSIHAHPDDAEILAGGTLALLSALGHDITIVTLSAGDCGSAVHGLNEIAAIRQAEAAESAALIGARYRWGGFRDMAIFSDDPSRPGAVTRATAGSLPGDCTHGCTERLSLRSRGDQPACSRCVFRLVHSELRDTDGKPGSAIHSPPVLHGPDRSAGPVRKSGGSGFHDQCYVNV